jgi:hypothetical protein
MTTPPRVTVTHTGAPSPAGIVEQNRQMQWQK